MFVSLFVCVCLYYLKSNSYILYDHLINYFLTRLATV